MHQAVKLVYGFQHLLGDVDADLDLLAADLIEHSRLEVRCIVAELQADEPEHRERIGRAVTVLLTCEIRETDELGVYLVQSSKDSGTFYRATGYQCACPDMQRRGPGCKHSRALQVLSVASAIAAYARAEVLVRRSA